MPPDTYSNNCKKANDMDFIEIPRRAANITGERFARLVVLGPVAKVRNEIKWLCQCDCGGSTVTTISSLRSGHTKSCGCVSRELSRQRRTTHSLSTSETYTTYQLMMQRCKQPKYKCFAAYGGRGISVCVEWKGNFQAFYDHVSQLENFGVEGMTLDRIDNDKNYEPDNVRWATIKDQQRNRRNNRLVTYRDKTQCLSAWAEELGIDRRTLTRRLNKGLSPEEAFTGIENAARYLESMKQ